MVIAGEKRLVIVIFAGVGFLVKIRGLRGVWAVLPILRGLCRMNTLNKITGLILVVFAVAVCFVVSSYIQRRGTRPNTSMADASSGE